MLIIIHEIVSEYIVFFRIVLEINDCRHGKRKEKYKMIRVIASDMDGTLLDKDHKISERNVKAVKDAVNAGIRFIIATGRSFEQAIHVLEGTGIECDYIVYSGAEIRNSKQEILKRSVMNLQDCRMVYEILKEYDLMYLFGAEDVDYCIGSTKDREKELVHHILTFHPNMTEKEARESVFCYILGLFCFLNSHRHFI